MVQTERRLEGGLQFEVFEVSNCSACLGSLVNCKQITAESSLDYSKTYQIVICDICGLGHTNPRPTAPTIQALYEPANSHRSLLSSRDFDPDSSKFFRWIKDWAARREVRERVGGGRPLAYVADFGTGNGRFANQLRLVTGALTVAVDYSYERPLQLDRRVVFKEVRQFFDDEILYDIIFLRHVLEHADNPVTLLMALSKKLAKGGCILLEVPNFDSGLRYFFPKSCVNYYLPRHIHHFSRFSLLRTIERAGLVARIEGSNLPVMGNQIARLVRAPTYSLPYKLAGVLTHWLQVLIESVTGSSTSLRATARNASIRRDSG